MKIFQTLTLTLMMALMGSAAFAAEDTGNVVTVHFNTNKNPTYHSVTFRPGGADTSQSPSVKIVSGNKQGEGQLAFWNPQGQITTFIDGASGTMSLRHTDLKDNASVVNVYAMKNLSLIHISEPTRPY